MELIRDKAMIGQLNQPRLSTLVAYDVSHVLPGTISLSRFWKSKTKVKFGMSNYRILFLMIAQLLLKPGITNAQSPHWIWAGGLSNTRFYGDSYGNAVTVSQSGDVYTTGTFIGIIDFDPGSGIYELNSNGLDAIYISKLNAAGDFVWAKAIGSVVSDYYSGVASSIAIDTSGNIYISSWYDIPVDFDPGPDTNYLTPVGSGDIFIVKLNSSGNFIWVKTIGGNGLDFPNEIMIDTASNYLYVTGKFNQTVDFDPGPDTFNLENLGEPDIFITKLNLEGDFAWAKAIEGFEVFQPHTMTLDSVGNLYTTGNFLDTVDIDPGPNEFELTSNGAWDIFILKLDADGNYVWAKSIGGSGWDIASNIVAEHTGIGSIIITGYFAETVDFDPGSNAFTLTSNGLGDIFVLKLDYSGNFIWACRMGGVSNESGIDIRVDQNGNGGIYITGYFSGTCDFDPGTGTYNLVSNGLDDIFFSKLSSAGNFVWAYGAGGESFDYCWSITLDLFGNGYITGFFQSYNTTFGNTTLINNGNSTAFVSKFFACNGIVSDPIDGGLGSLRNAISCSPYNTIITFNLPPMSQITLTSGEILIDRHLSILGTGINDLTISGNNASRIFNLLPGKNLIIESLSLKNAVEVINGGAVYVKGNLTLKNALLENNFENGVARCMTLVSPGSFTSIGQVDIRF